MINSRYWAFCLLILPFVTGCDSSSPSGQTATGTSPDDPATRVEGNTDDPETINKTDDQAPQVARVPEKDPEDDSPAAPSRVTNIDSAERRRVLEDDDPEGEGWHTEVLQSKAKKQLYALGKLLEEEETDLGEYGKFLATDFSCGSLRPKSLDTAFSDEHLEVTRLKVQASDEADGAKEGEQPKETEATDTAASESDKTYGGSQGFIDAFKDSLGDLKEVEHLHFAFKVYKIHQHEGYFSTKQYVTVTGTAEGHGFEQNTMWAAEWIEAKVLDKKTKKEKDGILLRKLELREFEQTKLAHKSERIFNECTEAVLGDDPHFVDTVVRGIPYWLSRIDNRLGGDIFGHQGITLADVNGDGLDDVYMCQACGMPDRLFIRNPDGTATDIAAEAGVDWADMSSCALFVDFDNDGDQDLVVCTRVQPATLIMSNDGKGHFKLEKTYLDIDYLNPSAADYDGDGDLDLYLCAQRTDTEDLFPSPMPLHDANNGGRNALFRNDGNFEFTDVTEEVGLDVNNRRYSFAASWDDYDGDGDLDIYVANDWGRNNLYRNDGGKFVDVTEESGAEDGNFGMSVSWGDFNRDGRPDIYVANMYSSAGNRVMFQDTFKPDQSSAIRNRFRKLARGNTLMANLDGKSFQDVSEDAGVTLGRWAWGSNFMDINNDGWQDLIVANGYVTNEDDTGDL